MTFSEMLRNKDKIRLNGKAFADLFHADLGKYMNLLTGFDLEKFDNDVLKTPGDCDIRSHITDRYGKKALRLVERKLV